MADSKRLASLKREIVLLRKQFLPAQFDNLGVYPDMPKVQASTRAFLVLCHAAFESYFEEWAKDIARNSEKLWKKSGKVSVPFGFLLATMIKKIGVPTVLNNANDSPQLFNGAATALFQDFYSRIKDNHGIKEANVLSLFVPLGIPASAFGSTLLPSLQTFGELRGEHAHHSGKAVISAVDPETEWKRIEQLSVELASFDAWCAGVKKAIR
ncbi:HEPN domain-containing protein [Reyranella sp.]|uniref:HEPN domain-containing protein n=1 Tax=Reyranella sp. TaxID=1929291 RepID=UPI003D1486BB